MRRAAAIALSLLFAPALLALAAPTALKPATCNAPIAIASDQFIADNNAKTGTWSGNVIITQCEMRMHADSVRADVTSGKTNQLDKIYAKGHLVVDSPAAGTVTGDNGIYDVATRIITLTGHVILNKEKKVVMSGSQLTVNLVTGVYLVTAKGTPTGRVQGLFTAPPQSTNQTANPGSK